MRYGNNQEREATTQITANQKSIGSLLLLQNGLNNDSTPPASQDDILELFKV